MSATTLKCLHEGDNCRGIVQITTTDGFKFWPRCEKHHDEAMKVQERANEYMSPAPADWFDESYAGERWDDDY